MKKTAFKSISMKFSLWVMVVLIGVTLILGISIYSMMKNTETQNLNEKVQLAIGNVQNLTNMYINSIGTVKNQIVGSISDKLQQDVEIAYNIANKYYQEYQEYLKNNPYDSESQKQEKLKALQKKALDTIGSIKYDNGVGYIWVNDMNAIMLEHPEKSLIGKNLYNLQDKNGKYIFKEMIKICTEKGQGFVDYLWPKPGKKDPQPKRSFVREFKPWKWVIGTGEYIDDQMALIAKKQDEIFQAYRKQVLKISIGDDSYAIILNKSNDKLLFKVYINPDYEGKPLPSMDQKGNPLASGITGDSGVLHYYWPKNGSKVLYAKTLWYQYVPQLKWYIVFAVYDDEVYAPLKNIMTFTYLGFGLGLLSLLILIILLTKIVITSKLKLLPEAMDKFSQGDLTVHIKEPKGDDEIIRTIKATNAAVKGLEKLIVYLKDRGRDLANTNDKTLKAIENTKTISVSMGNSVEEISSDVQNISANIEEVNAGQEEFATAIQRIADETSSMADMVSRVSTNLKEVSANSDKVLSLSKDLGENADKTMSSVNNMMEKVNLITDFANSIASISEQTNLLALNAAIEAARAGESGKGFAVIADEIRELANESKSTAEKIASSIKDVKDVSNVAVQEVSNTNKNIKNTIEHVNGLILNVKNVIDQINEIDNAIHSVSSSVEETNATSEELASAMNNIAGLFESVVTKSETIDKESKKQEVVINELSDVADTLGKVVESLNRAIKMFKLAK